MAGFSTLFDLAKRGMRGALSQTQEGAPADFGGAVYPNPDGLTPREDTASEPTRLSNGASLEKPTYRGNVQMDVSNPPMNQMGAPPMREAGARLVDRIQDDPRQHVAALDDSTADLESRVGPKSRAVAPDDFSSQLEQRYQREANYQPKKLSLARKIGLYALAPFGSLNAYQGERDYQQGVHQRNAESLLSQIEAERRMQEQEDIEGQRIGAQERAGTLREQMAQRAEDERNQRLIETIRAQDTRQQAGFDQQTAQQDRQFKQQTEQQGRQFGEQEKLERMRENAKVENQKPTADEQRRADLAENMTENLNQLEDIVNRKPNLFGPMAGRLTQLRQWTGTDDPDIAKLKAIKEYLGMASVGAHAMRNAQHVGTAADAVMAGFLNSPDATRAAIQSARQSIETFKQDIQTPLKERIKNIGNPKPETQGSGRDLGGAPSGSREGRTGTLPDGTKVIVRNGRLVAQ